MDTIMTEEGGPVIPQGRLQNVLKTHSKPISIIIVLTVVFPIAFVVLQVAPASRTLPAAVDFRMLSTEGTSWTKLSDNLGKVVLLDLMATWCVTCEQSMPDLLEIHARYPAENFVLLSVTASSVDTIEKMHQFKVKYSANWTFAIPFDVWTVADDYSVSGFPTYILLDREGQITYRAVGLVPLETVIMHIDQALNA